MATISVFVREQPTRTVVVRPPANVSSMCIVFTAQTQAQTQTQAQSGGDGNQRSAVRLQPTDTIEFSLFRPLTARAVFGCLGAITVANGKSKPETDSCSFSPSHRFSIYRLFGAYHLESIDVFVALALDAEHIGLIEGQPTFRLVRPGFFSLLSNRYDRIPDPVSITSTQSSFADDQPSIVHPCQQLIKLLSSNTFHFSPTLDLTRRMDQRFADGPDATSLSVLDTMDLDYVWNREMIRPFLQIREQELSAPSRHDFDRGGHLIPLIQGFVGIESVSTRTVADPMTLGIISRLNCNRAGTRFNARGINDDGHVSNFVETEFLIYGANRQASYLQLRGSGKIQALSPVIKYRCLTAFTVPVFWEQTGIQVSHKVVLSRGPESTLPAAQKHFQELVRRYSQVQVINLLNQSPASTEYQLTEAFKTAISSLPADVAPAVLYSAFDFHAIIKRDQYERLEELLEQVGPALERFGYLVCDSQTKTPFMRQTGIFRTNCLDCLDRTSVVQTYFARRILDIHLTNCNIQLSPYETEAWNRQFNGLWADNSDWLTGTGALKSSYTRNGKQTIFGFLDDATKSVNRFYVSNFQDKSKQETINLLFEANRGPSSLLLRNPLHEIAEREMEARIEEYATPSELTILLGTYNLNGRVFKGESLQSWLYSNKGTAPDLIVIGVQELIELTPGQFISADTNMLRLDWEANFLETINTRKGANYVILRSLHLVALGLFAFIKQECAQFVRNVETSYIKTGLGGMAANKGGIGISMHVHDTTMAFVTAHFAAGSSAVDERNNDYWTITNGLNFRGRKLYEHDMVFWFGDFNYRLNLANEEARQRILIKDYRYLVSKDQLREQMLAGSAFDGFTEGPISFDPTYKYDNGSNLMSDHRPVRAMFVVQVNQIDFAARDAIRRDLLTQLFTIGPEHLKLKSKYTATSSHPRSASSSAPPLPARSGVLVKPVSATPPQLPPITATGTLIEIADDITGTPGVIGNNPFLPSDPFLWSNPSGPLPPPSTDTMRWWQTPVSETTAATVTQSVEFRRSLLD
eukprot:jgi/Hompol1/4115/HPOL_003487-RA